MACLRRVGGMWLMGGDRRGRIDGEPTRCNIYWAGCELLLGQTNNICKYPWNQSPANTYIVRVHSVFPCCVDDANYIRGPTRIQSRIKPLISLRK